MDQSTPLNVASNTLPYRMHAYMCSRGHTVLAIGSIRTEQPAVHAVISAVYVATYAAYTGEYASYLC